jgi:hypothetical protein
MAKVAPDAAIDGGLTYIDGADYQCLCSAEPATYSDAREAVMLAEVALDAGDILVADDVSGRKATIGAKAGVAVTTGGTATHVALVKVGDTTLRYVTTCTGIAITSDGTVDFGSWKINIGDPT